MEKAPTTNPEMNQPTAETYQRMTMLTSDVVFDQYAHGLETKIDNSPELQEVSDLTSAQLKSTEQYYDALRRGDDEARYAADQASIHYLDQLEAADPAVRAEFGKIRDKQWQLDKFQAMAVDPKSLEAKTVIGIANTAHAPQQPTKLEAPFKNWSENNSEAWSAIDPKAVKEFLSERTWFDTHDIGSKIRPKIKIQAEPGQPIEVPADVLVKLQGFDGWTGRGGHGSGKRVEGEYQDAYDASSESLDVIKHYAALPTELPPAGEIRLFIQPNGVVFGDNGSGDSHRIAAAILRGDKTIKANSVSMECIETNIFEAQESEPVDEVLDGFRKLGWEGLDVNGRFERIANMTPEGLVAEVTAIHALVAPDEDQTPSAKMVSAVDREGNVTHEFASPEERFDMLSDCVTTMQDLCALDDGTEQTRQAILQRVSNVLALTLGEVHAFEDGNGRTLRSLALVTRFGLDTDEAKEDLKQVSANREFEGTRMISYRPSGRSTFKESVGVAASLDIPIEDSEAYRKKCELTFWSTFTQ